LDQSGGRFRLSERCDFRQWPVCHARTARDIWISTNTINWSLRTTGDNGDLYEAIFAQGFFVAVGSPVSGGQKIVTSPDGMNWKTRPVNSMLSGPLFGVTYGNGYFVAVGGKGIILTSDPVFRLSPVNGGAQWLLTGETGRSYHFQYSDNLSVTNWTDITNFTSVAETTLLTDPTANASNARFYRATSP
jgi:hypothetical protein